MVKSTKSSKSGYFQLSRCFLHLELTVWGDIEPLSTTCTMMKKIPLSIYLMYNECLLMCAFVLLFQTLKQNTEVRDDEDGDRRPASVRKEISTQTPQAKPVSQLHNSDIASLPIVISTTSIHFIPSKLDLW